MSVEATESLGEIPEVDFQCIDDKSPKIVWNGRSISLGSIGNHNPDINPCSYFQSSPPVAASPFWGYFDSEAKKQNEFDIAVYQYHVRCNNEESKKALESTFEKMATGMVGVVIGVIFFVPMTLRGMLSGTWMIYECGRQVWMGIEDFKRAAETSGTNLDEVRFVTWYDDYKRNTDELTRNTILDPWKPLDTSGFELMDKQYDRKLLDPTFNPWNLT